MKLSVYRQAGIQAMLGLVMVVGTSAQAAEPAKAAAQPGDEFVGYYMDSTKTAVINLYRCRLSAYLPANALCGKVVWDREVDNPKRTLPLDCNRQIAQFKKYQKGMWTDGFALDTRTHSIYQARLSLKEDGTVHVRSFLGSEALSQTEVFTPVDKVPPGCEGKTPESTAVRINKKNTGAEAPKPVMTKE